MSSCWLWRLLTVPGTFGGRASMRLLTGGRGGRCRGSAFVENDSYPDSPFHRPFCLNLRPVLLTEAQACRFKLANLYL